MKRNIVHLITSASLLLTTMSQPLAAQPMPPGAPTDQPAGYDPSAQHYTPDQLASLLAPIALYPDALLTQTLMASTYPQQIAAADQWLSAGANRALNGPALEAALQGTDWDPSVKSLVPFPQVLDMLNQRPDWTAQLAYAMQVQQPDVFAAVQQLRAQAMQAGYLRSSQQITVRTEPPPPLPYGAPPPPYPPPAQIIEIEPAQPGFVSVPFYNPSVVYGPWGYAVAPVYYPPPPGFYAANALAVGLAFGAGIALTAGLWGWARPNWGCCWGGWHGWAGRGAITVNVVNYNRISVNRPWVGGPNGVWHPARPAFRPGVGFHPPAGPVGVPARPPVAARPGAFPAAPPRFPGHPVPPGGMAPGGVHPTQPSQFFHPVPQTPGHPVPGAAPAMPHLYGAPTTLGHLPPRPVAPAKPTPPHPNHQPN